MNRSSRSLLHDLLAACDAIEHYMAAGGVDEGILFDAIRIRLVEVGEAVNGLDLELTATESEIPWADIARMRDHLAHRYFDTEHAVVFETARSDIPVLVAAVRRILNALDS